MDYFPIFSPGRPRQTKIIGIAVLLSAATLIFGLSITYLTHDKDLKVVLSDLLFPIVSLTVSAFLFYVSRQSRSRDRAYSTAWTIFALGLLLNGIGDGIWAVLEITRNTLPFPSIADAAYISYYIAIFIGMLVYPKKNLRRIDFIKTGLDAGTIVLGGILALMYFIVLPVYNSIRSEPLLTQVLTLAYPISDIVLFSASVILMYMHPVDSRRTPVLLLSVSCVIYCLADTVYSIQTLRDIYASGGLLDNAWLLAYIIYAWAGLSQLSLLKTRTETGDPILPSARNRYLGQWESYLPYIWLIGVFTLLIPSHFERIPWRFETLVGLVGIMIAMIMIRQIIAVNENFRLNQNLSDAYRQLRTKSTELVLTNEELQVQIAAHQEVSDRLSYEATHDLLTGLPNRTFLLNILEPEIAYARSNPERRPVVMFLDCDRFKMVNDSLGHIAGDIMLIQVAHRIRSCLRSHDVVSRFGGDEFIIYLPETNGLPAITHIADRILEALHEPFLLDNQYIFISASIGIVDHLSEYESPLDILRDADIAMYKAKELGKARYVIFNGSLGQEAYHRMQVERDLRQAINDHQLELFYQPIIHLKSGSVAGFESLLRWRHPVRGLILPAEFIALAEQTSLIRTIGKWALDEACAQFSSWIKEGFVSADCFISVNISSHEFLDPAFAAQVNEALASNRLSSKNLRLEITESVFMGNDEPSKKVFTDLSAMGIECLLDDFGTGYSSLGYLHSYPIHAIKIDRGFVWSIDTSRKQDMISAIMSVAGELGLQAVAEGIETEAQLKRLKQLGCQMGQGFLFATPMPAEQVKTLLQNSSPAVYLANLASSAFTA